MISLKNVIANKMYRQKGYTFICFVRYMIINNGGW